VNIKQLCKDMKNETDEELNIDMCAYIYSLLNKWKNLVNILNFN